MTLDLLATMTPILQEIGRVGADLPDPSTLCKAFERITIDVWRVLLRLLAQLHEPSDHVALDATYLEQRMDGPKSAWYTPVFGRNSEREMGQLLFGPPRLARTHRVRVIFGSLPIP
jgi:IS5 family transposase